MSSTQTDWRALCGELVDAIGSLVGGVQSGHYQQRHMWECRRIFARARAALAQPEPEVVGPSDEELRRLWCQGWDTSEEWGALKFARAVLACWSRPAPAAAGEVAELVRWLRDHACVLNPSAERKARRICDLLERQAAPVPVLPEDAQVIEPAQHTILAPAPVPVALSERPWEREGWCDSEGRCWIHCPGQSWDTWVLMVPQNAIDGAHCLPATALPLPSGEVQP